MKKQSSLKNWFSKPMTSEEVHQEQAVPSQSNETTRSINSNSILNSSAENNAEIANRVNKRKHDESETSNPFCSHLEKLKSPSTTSSRFANLVEPNQTKDFEFPSRTFGKFKRKFLPSYFNDWDWLHYEVETDTAHCFTCIQAFNKKTISRDKLSKAFTKTGFSNWKKATEIFSKHEASDMHCDAKKQLIDYCSEAYSHVDDMVKSATESECFNNKQMLLRILSLIKFHGR